MKKCEVLLEERNKLKDATEGRKILERKKLENKINTLLEEIRLDIKEMESELKHQKKKPNQIYRYPNQKYNFRFINKKI